MQLWADSVLCYAAARNHMPGRGPADALEGLEGGVVLLATVARCDSEQLKTTTSRAAIEQVVLVTYKHLLI